MAAPIVATNDAVLMIEPLPAALHVAGAPPCSQVDRLVRLTSCTRRQASRSVFRIESSSGGEIPALLKAMSTEP